MCVIYKMAKKYFWNGFRSRISDKQHGDYTPMKRPTSVTGGVKRLVINTAKKSPNHVKKIMINALEKIHKLKGRYITSNEEMNCAYLWGVMGEDLLRLKNIQIPSSILSETYTKEITINLKKCRSVKRISSNLVQKHTAKCNFQTALPVIMNCKEMTETDKQLFAKFFRLYDIKIIANKKIPCAEWCHMIAVSLSINSNDAMATDNLFAATAMVNTKMINFENSAKQLAREGYIVKVITKYAIFKNTATLAQLLQILIVTDKSGFEHRFEQTINPFEVNEVYRSTSLHDPKHVYNYIKDSMQHRSNLTLASNKMPLRFSLSELPKRKIIFTPDSPCSRKIARLTN